MCGCCRRNKTCRAALWCYNTSKYTTLELYDGCQCILFLLFLAAVFIVGAIGFKYGVCVHRGGGSFSVSMEKGVDVHIPPAGKVKSCVPDHVDVEFVTYGILSVVVVLVLCLIGKACKTVGRWICCDQRKEVQDWRERRRIHQRHARSRSHSRSSSGERHHRHNPHVNREPAEYSDAEYTDDSYSRDEYRHRRDSRGRGRARSRSR